jgi:hypothetical protein
MQYQNATWIKRAVDHLTHHALSHAHLQVTQSSQDCSKHYTRATLHKATFKLTDFGRAVPFKQLAAQQVPLDVDTPHSQPPGGRVVQIEASAAGESGARKALAYNADGVVVMSDPTLRPPEVLVTSVPL